MLTGLFFVGGVAAFVYLCWWIVDNEKHPDGMLPKRGLLAMALGGEPIVGTRNKGASDWRRAKDAGDDKEPPAEPGKKSRTPSYRRTGR